MLTQRAGEATTAYKAISGTVPRVLYNSGLDHHVPLYPIVCIASWADPARLSSHRQCPESVQTPFRHQHPTRLARVPGDSLRSSMIHPILREIPSLATSNLQIAARCAGYAILAALRPAPSPLPCPTSQLHFAHQPRPQGLKLLRIVLESVAPRNQVQMLSSVFGHCLLED